LTFVLSPACFATSSSRPLLHPAKSLFFALVIPLILTQMRLPRKARPYSRAASAHSFLRWFM
jgi:hypothetical protein